MARNSFTGFGLAILAVLGLAASKAHAQTTIAAYNFDGGTANSSAAGATPSSGSATFSNNFVNPGADVAYVAGETTTTGDTALRLNAGANGTPTSMEEGRYVQFAFDATGFSNLAFQYDTQRSGSGFTTQQVAYSTDGVTFINVTSSMISTTPASASTAGAPATINSNGTVTPPIAPATGSGYATLVYNFSSVSGLNSNANDIFRITFTGSAGTGSITANDRIDNLLVTGISPTPEPGGVASLVVGFGAIGLLLARRRRPGLNLSGRDSPKLASLPVLSESADRRN